MALIQPGVLTSPISGATTDIYQAVVDENGTVYFLAYNSDAVYSLAKGSSTPSLLPITGLSPPHGIDIDGAGTLYIAQSSAGDRHHHLQHGHGSAGGDPIDSACPIQPCSTEEYLYSVAVDDAGNLFALDIECSQIFELAANGTYTTTPIDPVMTRTYEIWPSTRRTIFSLVDMTSMSSRRAAQRRKSILVGARRRYSGRCSRHPLRYPIHRRRSGGTAGIELFRLSFYA